MTAEPDFSVVIPTYNRKTQVQHAVRSVLAQNNTSFEILVVDDGSTDGTSELIGAMNDARVRCIRQENSERGAARNTGTKNARGRFVTFLDSDDLFFPEHLDEAHAFFTNTPQAGIYCASYAIRSGQHVRNIIHGYDINRVLIDGNPLSCNGVFLRREIALAYPFSENRALSMLEDWELWLRIAPHEVFHAGTTVTSEMQEHDSRSVLQTRPEEIEKRFEIFRSLVAGNPAIGKFYSGKMHRLEASCETYMALHLALTKKYRRQATRHLFKGISARPSAVFTRRFLAVLKHLV